MSTADHQWLAGKIFPDSLIDRVMSKRPDQSNVSSNPDLVEIRPGIVIDPGELANPAELELIEVARLFAYPAGTIDEFGNTVIVSDNINEICVIAVKTPDYSGQIMLVKDPAQISVEFTNSPNEQGNLIGTIIKNNNGIAGINANGFADDNGVGNGGEITGWSVSGGVEWGVGAKNFYISSGFDRQNRFIVKSTKIYDEFRDMVQFSPALILDGKALVTESAGWGLQPRTAIGQRADGIVLLVTVDGRQLGHSIGITVGDLTKLMLQYGAINASSCDGGSSSVMMYDNKIIGIPSTPMKTTGRYLPNAIVVHKKTM